MRQLSPVPATMELVDRHSRIWFATAVGACGWLELAGAFIRPRAGDWSDDLFLNRTVLFGVLSAVGVGFGFRAVRAGGSQQWDAIGVLAVNASIVLLMARRLAHVAGLIQ